ncbi:hypothetical protein HPP92_024227 [Vanilla planifolia]|uniref:Uncharacterized protein n=1 Tax=Vanilla planifolia TaxID=51239 RepID=A0A835PN52_VANPL|nr:hypothetical protein HPP92_024543 [Vanilla planifolia]KAG0456439.1 hypothetical protein HPP92_024227 [Vanilla planifolia]
MASKHPPDASACIPFPSPDCRVGPELPDMVRVLFWQHHSFSSPQERHCTFSSRDAGKTIKVQTPLPPVRNTATPFRRGGRNPGNYDQEPPRPEGHRHDGAGRVGAENSKRRVWFSANGYISSIPSMSTAANSGREIGAGFVGRWPPWFSVEWLPLVRLQLAVAETYLVGPWLVM